MPDSAQDYYSIVKSPSYHHHHRQSHRHRNLWTTIIGKLPNAAAVDEEPAGAGFQEEATENCRVLPESH